MHNSDLSDGSNIWDKWDTEFPLQFHSYNIVIVCCYLECPNQFVIITKTFGRSLGNISDDSYTFCWASHLLLKNVHLLVKYTYTQMSSYVYQSVSFMNSFHLKRTTAHPESKINPLQQVWGFFSIICVSFTLDW